MNKRFLISFLIIFTISLSFVCARSYRVSMMPYGSNWSCNTCHTDGGGTPRNSFGQAVGSITGSDNVVFWGATLAALDSDGDTYSNGVELQDSLGTWTAGNANPGNSSLVTHPGDATDYPTTSAISELPTLFELKNNYPNPFNPITLIPFDLASTSNVSLVIYDLHGNKVRSLVKGTFSAGSYTTSWNGRNDDGIQLGSGIYFYRFTAGDFTATKQMLMMK